MTDLLEEYYSQSLPPELLATDAPEVEPEADDDEADTEVPDEDAPEARVRVIPNRKPKAR